MLNKRQNVNLKAALSDYILVTAAGHTDPIRGEYDGPILHICRNYRPHTVYLILTAEVSEIDKADNRYEQTLHQSISSDIKVIKHHTTITEAHDYDIYKTHLEKVFNAINSECPNCQIIANLSSGTQQFSSALALYISSSALPITPVQVPTPTKKGNYSQPAYHIEDKIECNIDHAEPTYSNRCVMPNLRYYSITLLKAQLKRLLRQYDYGAMIALLEESPYHQAKLKTILNFAKQRQMLSGKDLNNKLKPFNTAQVAALYYAKINNRLVEHAPQWYKLVEYYNVAKIKCQTGDYATYLLMLEPLSVELYLQLLTERYRVNAKQLFDYNPQKNSYKINSGRWPQPLAGYLRQSNISLSEDYINYYSLKSILGYYHQTEKSEYLTAFQKLDDNINRVKQLRNSVAHSLIAIGKYDIEAALTTSLDNFNQMLENFLLTVFKGKGIQPQMFEVYDILNDFIEKQIEQLD